MVETRFLYYTATALQDGRVLVTGGSSAVAINSCELYDPSTGSWSDTGKMKKGRTGHGAVLLPDGRVLVAGGLGSTTPLPELTETYDPATGLWTDSGYLLGGRIWHSTNVLPEGRVLVVGGATDIRTGYSQITRRCELETQATEPIAP
jgi:hypothetical protein